jgi:hypothetical protein
MVRLFQNDDFHSYVLLWAMISSKEKVGIPGRPTKLGDIRNSEEIK